MVVSPPSLDPAEVAGLRVKTHNEAMSSCRGALCSLAKAVPPSCLRCDGVLQRGLTQGPREDLSTCVSLALCPSGAAHTAFPLVLAGPRQTSRVSCYSHCSLFLLRLNPGQQQAEPSAVKTPSHRSRLRNPGQCPAFPPRGL